MTVVRKERLELSRYCYRQPLKLVRLPIPPLSRGGGSPKGLRYLPYFFGVCGAGSGAFSGAFCSGAFCSAGGVVVAGVGAVAGAAAGVVAGAGGAPAIPRLSA